MKTITEIMRPYFSSQGTCNVDTDPDFFRDISISGEATPISPYTSEWIKVGDPAKLLRVFSFDNSNVLLSFVEELIDYQEYTGHHSTITIDHLDVSIETYTKDVGAITELDLELAQTADDIFKDVMHFKLHNR